MPPVVFPFGLQRMSSLPSLLSWLGGEELAVFAGRYPAKEIAMENSKATPLNERKQEIRQVVELELSDRLAAANEAGYGTVETLSVMETVLEEQKTALAGPRSRR